MKHVTRPLSLGSPVITVGVLGFAGLASALLFAGCGSSSSSSNFNAPAIAPIVNSALPKGLQTSGAQANVEVGRTLDSLVHERTITPDNNPGSEDTIAQGYVKAMFSEYFINGINGMTYQGYLNSLVQAIDSRMAGINSQISTMGKSPACLSAAVVSETFNLGAMDSMLNFTVPYLQCSNPFSSGGGNVAGSGSGADFGTDGKGNYSLWIALNQSGTGTFAQLGGFTAVANILNYGSTAASSPETVDAAMVAFAPASGVNRITVARFTASPSINSFALFLASNTPVTSGGSTITEGQNSNNDSYLGSGLRLLSDGVHVYADGLLLDTTASPNEYYNFNLCLNAADLSVDSSPSDCATLANSYSTTTWATLYPGLATNPNPLATTPTLNFNEVTGCAATLPAADGGSEAASNPSDNSCLSGSAIPGFAANSDQTTPSASLLTALAGLTLPSTLTSLSQ